MGKKIIELITPTVQKLFKHLDSDNNGYVDTKEFFESLTKCKTSMPSNEVKKESDEKHSNFDLDKDGQVTYDEMLTCFIQELGETPDKDAEKVAVYFDKDIDNWINPKDSESDSDY